MDLPASQVPPLVLDRQLTTLALEKFSFAVTTLGGRSHQWVHERRADKLFLVFRQARQSEGEATAQDSLLMTVTVGSQILERQDLRKLKAMVVDFETQRQRRLFDHASEPPVRVVVKFPCIGLQYPTSLTHHRRIQIRFRNIADYQSAVDVFEGLKLPVNCAGDKDSPAAQTWPSIPASASIARNSARPYVRDETLISDVPKSYETRASSTSNLAYYATSRPPLTEKSPFFWRSCTANSDKARPSSVLSLDSSTASDTISSASFGEILIRPSSGLDDVRPISAPQLEMTARLPLLPILDLQKDHLPQPDLLQYQDRNPVFARNRTMSEAYGLQLPTYASISSNTFLSDSQFEFGRGGRPVSGYENPSVERFSVDKQQNRQMTTVPEYHRPLSAPIPSTPENLSKWLPPRRELPFPKARASAKSWVPTITSPLSSEPQSRAGERQVGGESAGIDQRNSTLAFPRTTKRVAQRHTKRAILAAQQTISDSLIENPAAVDQRGGELQMLAEREEEPSPLAAKSAAVSRPSTAQGLRTKLVTTTTRKRERETGQNTAPVSKQARTMADKATQTQTFSGRDHTALLALTTGTGPLLSSKIDEVIQPPESFMNGIDAFVSRHKHRPPPEELWQRQGYSKASPEEREAIINDFICENLDSEDFLKLCEDTGKVWRRIGLEI